MNVNQDNYTIVCIFDQLNTLSGCVAERVKIIINHLKDIVSVILSYSVNDFVNKNIKVGQRIEYNAAGFFLTWTFLNFLSNG